MDALDWSGGMTEGSSPRAADRRLSNTLREARIQGELDFRRSRSSTMRSISLARSLLVEEEDEMEGKAGDSGSARPSLGLGDGENISGEFSVKSHSGTYSGLDFAGSTHSGPKTPSDAHVVPISRSLSPVRNVEQANPDALPGYLDLISILAHLLTFGILGVLIRYLLEVLFGPDVAKVTSNTSALFIDLPANMLGSFFMGWVGVILKKDIAMYSEHLALGLSTGLMGSITTYAAMMQRNLAIMVSGSWVTGLCGLLIGVFLAQMALVVGEDAARLLLWMIQLINDERARKGLTRWERPGPDNLHRRRVGLVLFVCLGGGLWAASVALTMVDRASTSRRTLWLACWLAPPGVWTRWYLARLNGHGVGAKHHYRWFPVGTFLVNVAASSLEAGLTSVEKAAGNYMSTLFVGAINLGTLGCLSTVSTFVAEIQIMHEGGNWWRSYAYPIISMTVSLIIGILIYGVPVWSKAV